MALSAPLTIYGVHSVTMYDRATWEPFGIMKVIGSLNLNMTGSMNDLYGGSSRYAWESEPGTISAEMTMSVKEWHPMGFEKWLGATVTENAAEAAGSVTTLTNRKGTSVVVATTGIASVGLKSGSSADLKDGLYVVKVTGAAAVDVYAMTDMDFDEGTDLSFINDDLKITTAPLTITTSGGKTEIPSLGVEFTGGSGTIGMTTGDTASFEIRKINVGSVEVDFGQANVSFPAFGMKIASQKKGSGSTLRTQLFNCKGIGFPLPMSEMEWASADVTIRAFRDSTLDKVGRMVWVRGPR